MIDLLEITPNTTEVAQLIQRDQSSVSRIYRQVSDRLGLEFTKQSDGRYRALANQQLLADLRRSSQGLRLQQGPRNLRWVGTHWNHAIQSGDGGDLPAALERRWFEDQRSRELLEQRVLDLAVVQGIDLLPPAYLRTAEGPAPELRLGPLLALPLVLYPIAIAADPQHPLHRSKDLGPKRFADYPSLAGDVQNCPHSTPALQALGLGQTLLPVTGYSWEHWEGRCRDGRHLVASTPFSREGLKPHLELLPLPYATGLIDADVLLLQADLQHHPAMARLIQAIRLAYRQRYDALTGLEWLD